MAKKYALIIGNSTYEDQLLPRLDSPASDVDRLAQLLKSPKIGNFTDARPLKDASFVQVRIAIADLFAEKYKDDLLLLYFSGHGVKDDRGNLYFAMSDTRRNRLNATAIDSGFIKDEMANSRSKRQVIVLDSCFSGAFVTGFKGVGTNVITQDTFDSQGLGRAILTASNATQYAFEGNQVIKTAHNSLFTHFLLEGLENGQADRDNDGIITVDEWYEYAYEQIVNSEATQRPHKFVDSQEGDSIEIARTRFVGSYLNRNLSPAINIEKEKEKAAEFIDNLPTPSLILVNGKREEKVNHESLTGNLVINGDNLLAMKSLFSSFASKIKCAFIDPPYNTNLNIGDYIDIKIKGTKKKSKPHDLWMEMMYPRLLLLRELLSDDGVIFVSIDDTELNNLKWMMDEIFDSINWVCTFVWKRNRGFNSGNRFGVSIDHEYVVCYSRGTDFHFKGIENETDLNKYANPDNDSRGPWISMSLLGSADARSRPTLFYEITDPQTGNTYLPSSKHSWRYSKEKIQSLIDDGRVIWPKSPSGQPRQKRYFSEIQGKVKPISSVIGINLTSHRNFKSDSGLVFVAPKPVELIKLLVNQIPGDDFVVVDAFAGSGTTGQAILELNETDGGKRKFILIEADKQICYQILNERLRTAIENLNPAIKEHSKFRFFTLGEYPNA